MILALETVMEPLLRRTFLAAIIEKVKHEQK